MLSCTVGGWLIGSWFIGVCCVINTVNLQASFFNTVNLSAELPFFQ